MLTKILKGSDALGLCSYLLDPTKQPEPSVWPILATNMSGRSPDELAEEFEFIHNFNPRVTRNVCHFVVSLPPGEVVDRTKIAAISQQLLVEMGHQNCQYFVVQHYDRCDRNQVQHWHIATSAVDLHGRWVDDKFNYARLAQVSRKLEVEFGLQRSQIRPARQRQILTTGEYRLKERQGKTLPKERLWQILEKAAIAAKTVPSFVEQLLQHGVSVQLRGLPSGKVAGISYGLDGVAFPGGRLGAAYSFQGLQKHLGLDYQPERDNAHLRMLMAGKPLPNPSRDEVLQAIADNIAQAQAIADRMSQRHLKQQSTAETEEMRSLMPKPPSQPKQSEWER